jgi:alginate O-acetyltransferase complex protein AlgI
MLFTTPEFLVFFVVVLAVISAVKQRKFHHLFLLGASYFFFYFSSNFLIILLIASTLLDFYIGKKIWETKDKARKKWLLCASITGNIALLGFFKYYDFAVTQFNVLGNYFDLSSEIPILDFIVPIGISFYTFQTISYTVDIYRNQLTPSKTFWEYALFVAFFPQLVAGPILRAKQFLPQLREKLSDSGSEKRRLIVITHSNLKWGITIMSLGFLKKMFFADNIAPLVNEIFVYPIGLDSFTIFLGTVAYGIQIYGDFSGYTDIAIGAAIILGFKIPVNFNKPYFATSPADFWQRWHISLSTWLRDYLYIPLGGNQKSHIRTLSNLLIVMLLGGLWHGASWHFVLWGVLHGAYLTIQKTVLYKFPNTNFNKILNSKIGKIFAILTTQYLVFLAWIPFRVQDVDYMIYSMQKYVFFDFQTNSIIGILDEHMLSVLLIILFIILQIIFYTKRKLVEKIINLRLSIWTVIITIILAAIVFFYDGNPQDFIYFRF